MQRCCSMYPSIVLHTCNVCTFIQECTDPCCNALTCTLATGAQCHSGECCTSQCQFKSSTTVCRPADGSCDVEELCTGQAVDCPEDLYLQDGSLCNDNQAYCYSGECKTYNGQCQTNFASSKAYVYTRVLHTLIALAKLLHGGKYCTAGSRCTYVCHASDKGHMMRALQTDWFKTYICTCVGRVG